MTYRVHCDYCGNTRESTWKRDREYNWITVELDEEPDGDGIHLEGQHKWDLCCWECVQKFALQKDSSE